VTGVWLDLEAADAGTVRTTVLIPLPPHATTSTAKNIAAAREQAAFRAIARVYRQPPFERTAPRGERLLIRLGA
jgi:hypothetical protein